VAPGRRHSRQVRQLQRLARGRGDLAGDADVTQAIGAVGGDLQIQQHVVFGLGDGLATDTDPGEQFA